MAKKFVIPHPGEAHEELPDGTIRKIRAEWTHPEHVLDSRKILSVDFGPSPSYTIITEYRKP